MKLTPDSHFQMPFSPTVATILLALVGIFPLAAQESSRVQQPLVQFSEAGQIKCGTPRLADIAEALRTADPQTRVQIQGLLQRPVLPESYISPSGHFKIHYSNTGSDSVVQKSTMEAGVPDFVVVAAEAADKSYAILVDTLGFKPHLPDGDIDGPEYDFYFINLRSIYGETFFEQKQGDSWRYSAYTNIENDFSGNFATHGEEAVQVTVAHEYFHAIHFAYAFNPNDLHRDLFIYEMASTWFEDRAFDDVNDYFAYLNSFFRSPQRSLFDSNSDRIYASAIWLQYWLAERPEESLRRIFENLESTDAFSALQIEVNDQVIGENRLFADVMAEFYTWCMYTGQRAQPGRYFEEASFYPELTYFNSLHFASPEEITGDVAPIATNLYKLSVDASRDFIAHINMGAADLRLFATPEFPSGNLGVSRIAAPFSTAEVSALLNQGTIFLGVVNAQNSTREAFSAQIDYERPDDLETGLQLPAGHLYRAGRGDPLVIQFAMEKLARATVSIFTEDGRPVWSTTAAEGQLRVLWNGKTEAGEPVSSGIYFIMLRTAEGVRDMIKLAIVR